MLTRKLRWLSILLLGGLGLALASTLAFGGCAETNEMLGRNQQTWTLQPDRAVPGAEGKVQVAKEDNGNRDLKVEAHGLGAYIARMTAAGDYPRIVLGIVVMSLFVTLFNRLLWRPLYSSAEARLRLD